MHAPRLLQKAAEQAAVEGTGTNEHYSHTLTPGSRPPRLSLPLPASIVHHAHRPRLHKPRTKHCKPRVRLTCARPYQRAVKAAAGLTRALGRIITTCHIRQQARRVHYSPEAHQLVLRALPRKHTVTRSTQPSGGDSHGLRCEVLTTLPLALPLRPVQAACPDWSSVFRRRCTSRDSSSNCSSTAVASPPPATATELPVQAT